MQYTAQQYALALHDLTEGSDKATTEKNVDLFIGAIEKHGMTHKLPSILKAYKQLLTKKNSLPEVTVTTAEEISPETRKEALKELGIDPEMTIVSQVNPDMIGGILVKNNNKLLDFSLARRLGRIAQRMKGKK